MLFLVMDLRYWRALYLIVEGRVKVSFSAENALLAGSHF
jgi:hypothetical protein